MANRKISDFGLPIIISYLLLPIVFALFSIFLFSKTEYAGYIFIMLAIGFISKTSEAKRNDFLKSIFTHRKYLMIRAAENFILSIPFLLFLAYKNQYYFALALVVLSLLMVLLKLRTNINYSMPTPFGSRLFEYAVGFRKTFMLFPIAYFLTIMSISAHNFNLGFFSMIMLALVSMSYYAKPENEYFVWNYSLSSKDFLFKKIITAIYYFSLLCLPILIGLSVFFFDNILALMGFFFLCIIYLATIVLAKYAAYPHEMNLPQGILIALSIIFPPILIGVIPYFYIQSVKNLNPLLNDSSKQLD